MRIVAWNIRAGGGKRIEGIAKQIRSWQPDLVVLSEFRGTPPSTLLARDLVNQGLDHQLTTACAEQRARNGLLIASKFPLLPIACAPAPPLPARFLLTQVDGPLPLRLGGMHIPNRGSGYKRRFFEFLLNLTRAWGSGPGLLIGDTNSGLPDLDEAVPCFGPPEVGFIEGMADQGWHDGFRRLHPQARAYTWYSPQKENGFRLDQAFLNESFLPHIDQIRYTWGMPQIPSERRDALSDHAALLVDLRS